MSEYSEAAAAIAREAGLMIKSRVAGEKGIRKKGAVNLVTEVDVASQNLIVARLRAAFPTHKILAEEDGVSAAPDAEWLWIVDPLDGTTNFAHSYPVYGVSIALAHRGEVVAGAVFDPSLDEMFTAARGEGALLNGAPISVSPVEALDDALLGTGVPYWIREKPAQIMSKFEAFSVLAQGVRRAGAASLDLCAVACGRVDGFWEEGLAPWDTAAAALIIQEAGGVVSHFDGAPFDPYIPNVLAGNRPIHRQMLDVLGPLI